MKLSVTQQASVSTNNGFTIDIGDSSSRSMTISWEGNLSFEKQCDLGKYIAEVIEKSGVKNKETGKLASELLQANLWERLNQRITSIDFGDTNNRVHAVCKSLGITFIGELIQKTILDLQKTDGEKKRGRRFGPATEEALRKTLKKFDLRLGTSLDELQGWKPPTTN